MPIPQVTGKTGRIALGEVLGRGGEGTVYRVNGRPESVAKVYHTPASADRANKLQAMVAMASPQLLALTAWPTDVLRLPSGAVCGLLMPLIAGHKDIHTLYGPKSRCIEFPEADWRHLVLAAANTARAFAVIHDAGCVIGDVNHGGVRVAPNATVKLIDCDSFQIYAGGRHYLCEVGVENFTPPELQGRPFNGVVRGPNHDNFGLAVMVFNLLMMGRHPFAGRYLGQGEMPVEKAIAQFRYAYGRDRAALLMQPPPHTAPVQIVTPQVAELWERAFNPASIRPGGRPTAKEWVTALAGLTGTFVRCGQNPGHQYLRAFGSCPWCPIEAQAGVLLFSIPVAMVLPAGQHGAAFNIEMAWVRITAIATPGNVTVPTVPTNVTASIEALAVGTGRQARRYGGAAAVIAFVIWLMTVSGSLWFIWIFVGWMIWAWMNDWVQGRAETTPYLDRKRMAETAYNEARERWAREATEEKFLARRRELEALKQEWKGLPALRQTKYNKLLAEREKNERHRYLEKFEIEKAKIPGIGPAKRTMLESYGIETAADINHNDILNVPGFGPAMASRLESWRMAVERGFRFNPNSAVDPRDVTALDRQIAQRKIELETALNNGPAELARLRATILAQRNALQRHAEMTAQTLAQANADVTAVS